MLRALQARCLQSCGVGGNAWLGAPGIGGLTGCLEAPAQQGGVQHGLLSDRSNERAPYSSGAQTSGVLNRFYKEATVAQADGTPVRALSHLLDAVVYTQLLRSFCSALIQRSLGAGAQPLSAERSWGGRSNPAHAALQFSCNFAARCTVDCA